MFVFCESIESIKLPESVQNIGRRAFMGCSMLNSIDFPENLIKIDSYAFSGCYNMKSIDVECQELGENALETAYGSDTYFSPEKITYSAKLKKFDKSSVSFNGDVFNINANIETIENGAFANTNIKKFTVDKENPYFTAVDGVLFSKDMTRLVSFPKNNDDVTSFTVPNTVKTIDAYTFSGCGEMSQIKLPENLEEIGDCVFRDAQINEINIPKTVKSIGDGAFYSTTLNSIKIPNSVQKIGKLAFYNCMSLQSVTLPDCDVQIGDGAFSGCGELKSVFVPQNCKSICNNQFLGCVSLEGFSVAENSKYLTTVDGVLFNSDKTTLVAYPFGKQGVSYKVPGKTTSIEKYAFVLPQYIDSEKDTLISVNIPSSVSKIGEYGVGYCLVINDNDDIKYELTDYFNIFGNTNSTAESFSYKNGISFFTEQPFQNIQSKTIKQGESFSLKIKGANIKSTVFSSSDKQIASVDKNGKITGVSKGSTDIIATVGTTNFVCSVKVMSGSRHKDEYSNYCKVDNKNIDKWKTDYYKANKGISFKSYDNSNIYCYSTNDYVPIVGVQKGGAYLDNTINKYGQDYAQYYTISENLSNELSKFKTDKDVVLYSGTNNLSDITGGLSTVNEMISSIGKQYTDSGVISTSVLHEVAARFGEGPNHTVLEIYAPKSIVKGAYIESISKYPHERELLLDKNLTYQIIDAGVRNVVIENSDEGTQNNVIERYVKMKIIDKNQPAAPTASTQNSATKATQNVEPDIPTGESSTWLLFVLAITACGIVMAVLNRKSKKY